MNDTTCGETPFYLVGLKFYSAKPALESTVTPSYLLELSLSLEPDDGLSAAAAELLEEVVEGHVRRCEHREGTGLRIQPHVQTDLERINRIKVWIGKFGSISNRMLTSADIPAIMVRSCAMSTSISGSSVA